MKRVLVVSYFYPPFSSVGATRVSKMTRYLRDSGWESHVLTVDRCDLPETLSLEVDPQAISRAPMVFDLAGLPRLLIGRRRLSQGRVNPSPPWYGGLLWRAGEVYRHLVCFPDAQIGWRRSAVRYGLEVVKRVQPDVILSSSLPNTSHLVARSIAARTGVPWVAELRDLWTRNHNFQRVQPLRMLEERMERSVLGKATALVTVSDEWAAQLKHAFNRPTFVVPNGYDPTDYPPPTPGRSDVFSLVYTGMFYNGKQSVDPLFAGVRALADAGRITPARFQMQFVGQYLAPIRARAEAYGVLPFTSIDPPIPYRDSLARQSASTALLFLDWSAPSAEGWYSAKIYEYLGAGRPVLAVGNDDTVVSRLLERTRAGIACSTGDAVAKTLDDWLTEFEATGALAYAAEACQRQQFQRQHTARLMADVLDHAAGIGRQQVLA